MQALAITNGDRPISPSQAAVERRQSFSRSRPLFVYVNAQAAQENPDLQAFIRYYLEQAPTVVEAVGDVPLPLEGYEVALTQFYRSKGGTVFESQLEPDPTIGEVLTSRASF